MGHRGHFWLSGPRIRSYNAISRENKFWWDLEIFDIFWRKSYSEGFLAPIIFLGGGCTPGEILCRYYDHFVGAPTGFGHPSWFRQPRRLGRRPHQITEMFEIFWRKSYSEGFFGPHNFFWVGVAPPGKFLVDTGPLCGSTHGVRPSVLVPPASQARQAAWPNHRNVRNLSAKISGRRNMFSRRFVGVWSFLPM